MNKTWWLGIAATLGWTSVGFAAEVEVGPGDDIRTLTASLGPGDVFIFRDGTYEIDGALDWRGLGTEADPIVMRAANGATPIIVLKESNPIARIADASWLRVKGLTFEGSPEHFEVNGFVGISIENSSSITVEDCVVRQVTYSGITLNGTIDDVRVLGTEIGPQVVGHGIRAGCNDASCWSQNGEFSRNWIHDLVGDNSAGVYVYAGGQGNVIADNVIHTASGHGVVTSSTEYGPQNVIEGNAIWDVGRTGIWVAGSAMVRNNVVFDTGDYGIYSENNRETLENLVISFNTVARTSNYGVRLNEWSGRTGMVFANNAIANPTGLGLQYSDVDVGNYLSGNVVSGLIDWDIEEPIDGTTSPGGGFFDFVDVEDWDFYPSVTSSLRDVADPAGDAYIPTTDFNGAERDGGSPDVGAYEWDGGDNPGWKVQNGFKEFDLDVPQLDQVTGCCGKEKAPTGSEALILLPLLGWGLRRRRRS